MIVNSKQRQSCLFTIIKAGYDRGYSLCQSVAHDGRWYLLKNGCGITIADSRDSAADNDRLLRQSFDHIFAQPVALKG
jgi:hypothetical protein